MLLIADYINLLAKGARVLLKAMGSRHIVGCVLALQRLIFMLAACLLANLPFMMHAILAPFRSAGLPRLNNGVEVCNLIRLVWLHGAILY